MQQNTPKPHLQALPGIAIISYIILVLASLYFIIATITSPYGMPDIPISIGFPAFLLVAIINIIIYSRTNQITPNSRAAATRHLSLANALLSTFLAIPLTLFSTILPIIFLVILFFICLPWILNLCNSHKAKSTPATSLAAIRTSPETPPKQTEIAIVQNLKKATNLCTGISIALSLISIIIVIQFILSLTAKSNSSTPYAAYNVLGSFIIGFSFFIFSGILSIILSIYLNANKSQYKLNVSATLPPATKRATIFNLLPPAILLTTFIVFLIVGLV